MFNFKKKPVLVILAILMTFFMSSCAFFEDEYDVNEYADQRAEVTEVTEVTEITEAQTTSVTTIQEESAVTEITTDSEEKKDPQNVEYPNDVTILYTNDVHSYIANKGTDDDGNECPLIDYSTVAAYKNKLKNEGKNVLLVDAGDFSQGSAYGAMDEGKTVISLMNAAGYDLATLGNHEFDYGQFRAFGIMSEADFPVISCNFYNVFDGSPVLEPYKIIEIGNCKIAFIGISTPETIKKSSPVYFQDDRGDLIYDFYGGDDGKELYGCVQKTIDEVKDKADYIIALGHLGIDVSSEPYTSKLVIENTTGLDAFIDGHSHNEVNEIVKDLDKNDVLLTQTGSSLSSIGQMTISNGVFSAKLISDYYEHDPSLTKTAESWINTVNQKLGEQIAVLDSPMFITEPDDPGTRIVRNHETNLGDFCADACYYYFNEISDIDCDFAIQNGGGVRSSVEPGEFTYLTSKNVAPFGNIICLVEITGKQMLDVLEKGAVNVGEIDEKTGKKAENGGFLHVAGIQYTIDTSIKSTVSLDENGAWLSGPSGEYRVRDVKVYNRETGKYDDLDPDRTYRLGGINYILRNQGDGFAMLKDLNTVVDYVTEDYLMLSEYAKSFKKSSDGFAHINTENSPLSSCEGYLLDYEDPYGSGRIIIK